MRPTRIRDHPMKKINVIDLLSDSRKSLSGHWSKGVLFMLCFFVLVTVIYWVFYGLLAIFGVDITSNLVKVLQIPIDVFCTVPLFFACVLSFLAFVKDEKPINYKDIFQGFNQKYYLKSISVYVLVLVYTVLWTFLLIVPGIIKGLSYSLAPFIIAENPELSAEEAIQRSMKMMNGHKMELFLLNLLGAGLVLLSVFTLCIAYLWLLPWLETALTKFYFKVKADYEQISE